MLASPLAYGQAASGKGQIGTQGTAEVARHSGWSFSRRLQRVDRLVLLNPGNRDRHAKSYLSAFKAGEVNP